MNEEKKYLDEISAKQLIDSTKEYVQNEIDGIETLGIQYNEEESALEFVGGSVITGSDSGSGGASSKEYSLIENKLYINPTGNSIGMNTITCSTGTLGSVFDKTSVEIMTNFVVKESTEDAVVYNIDKVEIGTRTGTALGAFDGRFVKIFVGAYLLDILEKIKSDGTISYITTYEPRKDIISPVEKTDEMTQEVGLDSNTGKLYTAPGSGTGGSEVSESEKFSIKSVLNIDVSADGQVIILPLANYGVHLNHSKTYSLRVCDYMENGTIKGCYISENANYGYYMFYNLIYGDDLSSINLNEDSLLIEIYLTGDGDRVTTTRNMIFTIEEI